MENIFGIPMGTLAAALALILALLMVPVIVTVLFQRVMFRIGIRNIPRRRAQTILIVLGLMLSTLIMSSAFGFGDSFYYSIKKGAYDQLGPIDETLAIKSAAGTLAQTPFAEAIYAEVAGKIGEHAAIDGYIPSVTSPAAVYSGARSEPGAQIVGLPAEQTLQELRAEDGTTLADLLPGEVLINAQLAGALNLAPGDTVQVYAGPVPTRFMVGGILPNGGLAGIQPQVTAPLRVVQSAAGLEGQITAILISNRGDVAAGVAKTDAASAVLSAAIAGTPLAVEPVKQVAIAAAESTANIFTTLFIVFGLFSVMVGVLLIFMIFVMLAAERRPEMGISRAVGTKRRHLIASFLAEGAAYSILSAAVGAALGVLVSWLLIDFMGNLIAGETGWDSGFDVQPRSLIVAYCLGMIITFLTVIFSSWRVSRLNIVAAIRNLPEMKISRPRSRATVVAGLVFLGAAALVVLGWQETSALAFWIGTAGAIIAAGLLAVRFGAPERAAYSVAGLLLLAAPLSSFYAGDKIGRLAQLSGGLEMFFLFGMMLVAGAVCVTMYNAVSLLTAMTALFRRSKALAPVLKTAFAYPLAYPFRTGLTTAMFALVVFSLVIMSVVTSSFTQDAAGISKWAGGFMVQAAANPNNAPRDVAAQVAAEPTLRDLIAGAGTVAAVPAEAQQQGSAEYGAVALKGGDPYFIANTQYKIKVRATGYADDRAIWDALARDPGLAVVSANSVPASGDFGERMPFMLEGVSFEDATIEPLTVMLRSPLSGKSAAFTVIGVLDENNIMGPGAVYTSLAGLEQVAGRSVVASEYYFKLAPAADEIAVAEQLETVFAANALQATPQTKAYNDLNAIILGILTLIQLYMGLGLLVGIAALGVIAIRSVVERRQQIGVLRAIGFKRWMVQAGFMIESSFIAILGIAIGVTLGVVLSYLMRQDPTLGSSGGEFNLPWLRLGVIILAAYVAAVLLTYLPARQAGNVPVAEALRFD